jgi:integrase
VVDKPKQRSTRRIEPLAPAMIEAIRDHMPAARDRLLVSLMGYQGLRPDEATRVRVNDFGNRSLYVLARKTDRARMVNLLAPVEREVREYVLATGIRDGLLFPRRHGGEWADYDWRNWRRRVYQGTAEQPAAARKAGVTGDMRPYRLRGSFVSLLLWEGRSVAYVAEQAGHDVATLAEHYAGVLAELEGQPRVSAEQAIENARAAPGHAQLRLAT